MSAFRILASPKVWTPVVGAAAVLALIHFAYLAAVANPEKNLEDLPVALVNEDQGGRLAGETVRVPHARHGGGRVSDDALRGGFRDGWHRDQRGVERDPGPCLLRGLAPLETLPPFYQAYADWLPLRYVIDGLRSLLFYDGTLATAGLEGGWRDSLWFLDEGGRSEAAGLEDAVWMLGAYLAGAAGLGYAISLVRDLLDLRKKPRVEHLGEPVTSGRQ